MGRNNEFNKFASMGRGISSMTLHRYESAVDSYINPTIIEERKLNVASMDVFSRLMMDRIIFLGVPIDDDVANIIQAQLLFLASNDSAADISLYLNTPADRFLPVLPSMIPCSSWNLMSLPSVQVWRLPWVPYCSAQVLQARDLPFLIAAC